MSDLALWAFASSFISSESLLRDENLHHRSAKTEDHVVRIQFWDPIRYDHTEGDSEIMYKRLLGSSLVRVIATISAANSHTSLLVLIGLILFAGMLLRVTSLC